MWHLSLREVAFHSSWVGDIFHDFFPWLFLPNILNTNDQILSRPIAYFCHSPYFPLLLAVRSRFDITCGRKQYMKTYSCAWVTGTSCYTCMSSKARWAFVQFGDVSTKTIFVKLYPSNRHPHVGTFFKKLLASRKNTGRRFLNTPEREMWVSWLQRDSRTSRLI